MGLTSRSLPGMEFRPRLFQLGGKAVRMYIFTAHFHKAMISTERGQKFMESFEKETGKDLDAFSAMAADAYFIILDAIKRRVARASEN